MILVEYPEIPMLCTYVCANWVREITMGSLKNVRSSFFCGDESSRGI